MPFTVLRLNGLVTVMGNYATDSVVFECLNDCNRYYATDSVVVEWLNHCQGYYDLRHCNMTHAIVPLT